jgi:hypothetical protein
VRSEGQENLRVGNTADRNLQQVLVDHDQVRELALLDGAETLIAMERVINTLHA